MHRGGVLSVFCHLASFPVNDRHHSLPSSDGFTFENDAVQEEKLPSQRLNNFQGPTFPARTARPRRGEEEGGG